MRLHGLRVVLGGSQGLRLRIALGVLLGALTIGASVGLMATAGYLISRASEHPPILSLSVAMVAVRFFGISRGVLRYLERLASHDAALRLLARLRVRFYADLEPRVPGGLDRVRRGDLLSRFVGDVDALQDVIVRAVGPVAVAVVVVFGAIVAAALVLPSAGVVIAISLVVAGLAVPAISVALVHRDRRIEAPARAALTAAMLDVAEAAPEIVAYGRSDEALASAEHADARLRQVRRRAAVAESTGDALVTLVAGASVAVVVAVCAPAVRSGQLDGVLVAMLALLLLATYEAVRPLPLAAQRLGETAVAADRVVELASIPVPVADVEPGLPDPAGEIVTVAGLGVSYGGRRVFDGVDLELRRGRIVALVGASGAGKTTLAECLVRFEEPSAGTIAIDGIDVRSFSQEQVRRTILLVEQDPQLFATTIRENLLVANRSATDDELEAALRAAAVWEWVAALPEGLETFVGELGGHVSGGQRRRLSLARAFLSTAPVVVLDEPTAHLHPDEESHVLGSLEALKETRAVLLISHAARGVAIADEVVRLG